MKANKKQPSMAALIAEQKLDQGYQNSITSGWPRPIKEKKEGLRWTDCPICVGKTTVQGFGHLYCSNCNQYYTVTQHGELEAVQCP